MKLPVKAVAIIMWLFYSIDSIAQTNGETTVLPDTSKTNNSSSVNKELDIIDAVGALLHKGKAKRTESTTNSNKLRLSVVPAAGYTLQTEFAGLIAANAAFHTHTDANTSTISTSFTYTARNQILIPLQTSIWTRGNKYNFVTDWRYLYFPSYTFGLGGYSKSANGYIIEYSALQLHQAALRELADDMYAGIGYNMDYIWNIYEKNPPGNKVTDFETYGFARTEFASCFTLNFLYDTRKNSINPEKGNYVNLIYRPNLTLFGNTANWRSLVLDVRKYVKFPSGSKNVLAFWSYDWLTINGKPPYLMLPFTGGDPYTNTGRGYIQGRFRGANLAYAEAEYRFGITHNGLLGGVVFANAQSFTEQSTNNFETFAPGWGAGIRIKFNKFSRANVALDYGFGLNGSGGLFVNIGEVF